MVTLSDTGVSLDRESTTSTGQTRDSTIKSIHQLPLPSQSQPITTSSSTAPIAAPRHLMDVPEGEVVQLDEPPRTPLSPRTSVEQQEVPFPINHPDHGIEIVDSPDSIKDTFPSPGLAPPYPTASSSTALYQNFPFGGPATTRPSTSRRTSNASSVHPNIYHSPRIAPRSPPATGSPAGSRPPSRAPSLGSHHALNAGLSGRTRSLSNQSGSSTSGRQGANVSRRSSAAGGGWRQSFSGGLRARPPSTLIPAPGHESDTIPPSSSGSGSNENLNRGTIKGSLLPAASLRGSSPRPRSPGTIVIKDFAYTVQDDRFVGVYPGSSNSQPASRASSEAGDLFFSSGLPSGLGRSGSRGGGSGNRRKSSFGGWAGFFGGWGGRNRDSGQSGGLGLGNLTKVDTDVDLSSDLTPSSSFAEEGKSPLIGITRDENGERHHHDVWEDDVSGEGELDGEEEFGPEPVGRYRVAYAFEGLGGHEMNVEEGDMLDVKGRGGGVGWVIAVRLREASSTDELMEGLVPESYLEIASES